MPQLETVLMAALATAALGMGPILYRLAQRRAWVLEALDGFVLLSITGIVLLFLLPGAVAGGGMAAVAAAVVGLAAPILLERTGRVTHRRTHLAVLAFGMAALAVHAAFDGVALAGPGDEHAETTFVLPLAVLIHRAPLGVAVWALVRPSHGRRIASTVLAVVAAATLVGFGLGQHLLPDGAAFSIIQGFMAGSLLHVVFHGCSKANTQTSHVRWAQLGGALLGLLLVLSVPHSGHEHGEVAQVWPVLATCLLALVALSTLSPQGARSWLSSLFGGGHDHHHVHEHD